MDDLSRIAVVGAGVIGRAHVEALAQAQGVTLAAIVDRGGSAQALAVRHGVPNYQGLDDMIAAGGVDGVILAVPNAAHMKTAMTCIRAGLPVLVEKPFATDIGEAEAVLAAAACADIPVLTGHHRRYNPIMRKAVEIVQGGRLGQLTAVQAQTWVLKPDSYFEPAWRTRPGAGPVYTNLIHDIDLLQSLCGRIKAVQAMETNHVRGNAVEESAVVLLRFESGLLGTMNISDAASAPWSWELTARENPDYPATDQNCYKIAGTQGSLALPSLTIWSHDGPDGWHSPISATTPIRDFSAPLTVQAAHFGAVIRREAAPIVSGAAGLDAVRVVAAIKRAAQSGVLEQV